MKARKRFGQHFLEPAWVNKLVAAINPSATDRVIEIGPGRGAITAPLAPRVEKLLGIEVDRDLAAALMARSLPNVTVLVADVLEIDLGVCARDVGGERQVRVVGNLPYNISSPILFRLLDAAAATGAIHDATLMLQKEVADRLVASPGTSDYGVLTLSTALGADVTTLLSLPPGAFRPAPKVRSAVVRLAFRPPPEEVRHPKLMIEIVRGVFTQRRKMLSNALAPLTTSRGQSADEVLAAAGVDGRRRPETLTLADVSRLADAIAGS